MFRRILVPIDGSAASDRGLEQALELARTLSAKVKVLHVVDESAEQLLAPSMRYQRAVEAAMETGKKVLADAQVKARDFGMSVEVELIETIDVKASALIVSNAREWRADLIVMGTHGRRGLSRVVMGSDAEQVLRSCEVPVMLIKELVDSTGAPATATGKK